MDQEFKQSKTTKVIGTGGYYRGAAAACRNWGNFELPTPQTIDTSEAKDCISLITTVQNMLEYYRERIEFLESIQDESGSSSNNMSDL